MNASRRPQQRLLTKPEIIHGLKLLRSRGFPMSIIGSLAGVSRIAIWRVRQGQISDAMQELLSPIVGDALNGRLVTSVHGVARVSQVMRYEDEYVSNAVLSRSAYV